MTHEHDHFNNASHHTHGNTDSTSVSIIAHENVKVRFEVMKIREGNAETYIES